jgi:hypothetical protein
MKKAIIATVASAAFLLLTSGCGSTRVSRDHDPQTGGVYKIQEHQADLIAREALSGVLGDAPLLRVERPHKGYQASFRIALDTHDITIFYLREGSGYAFQVKDSGTIPITGGGRANEVMRIAIDKARATAKNPGAVIEAPQQSNLSGAVKGAQARLSELKSLKEQGLISAEEFERKRQSILNDL